MLPSDERLHADQIPADDLHFRLIVENELVSLDRPAKLHFQLQPADRGEVHRRVEDFVSRSSVGLRLVHGDVGVADEVHR